jgi:hypothetical protein
MMVTINGFLFIIHDKEVIVLIKFHIPDTTLIFHFNAIEHHSVIDKINHRPVAGIECNGTLGIHGHFEIELTGTHYQVTVNGKQFFLY